MKEIGRQFNIVIPADLEKSSDGDWIVSGLASTASRDQQGEVLLPEGMDLSAIDSKKGILNWDHQKGPENTIGTLDSYSRNPNGLFIKGRLFKNHTKAKAVYEIMSSLGKSDRGRVGLSVEGRVLERDGKDGKIIKKCKINAVALTLNPVNQDTYADLVKSLSANDVELEFDATEEAMADLSSVDASSEPKVFTASEVVDLVSKALEAGHAYTKLPQDRAGGEALSQESLDKDKLCKSCEKEPCDCAPKKLKKMSKEMYKSSMVELLDNIQKLYPDYSRSQIWEAVKDRLNRKFPDSV